MRSYQCIPRDLMGVYPQHSLGEFRSRPVKVHIWELLFIDARHGHLYLQHSIRTARDIIG